MKILGIMFCVLFLLMFIFLQGESKWKYRHNYYTENMGLFNWQSFIDIYFWITNIRNYLFVRDLEQRIYR